MHSQTPFAGKRYNTYGRFLRERFGGRVYKVSVDGGFSCPNRDGTVGTGGCIYCNNSSFRPKSASRLKPVAAQVLAGMEYIKKRYGAEKFIVYFQPFSNTHAPLEDLIPLYESAIDHPDIVGLSVGTRPDCIDDDKIAWFENLARTLFVTLEYGLQSTYDDTLKRINRGHDYGCWLDAMRRTRDRGIWIGTHLILGFPWETREEILKSAKAISDRGIDFLKLHHLHVVKNTAMERDYRNNPFHLMALDEYVELAVDYLERLNPAIRIERLLGSAPPDQLIGPVWDAGKGEIRHRIEHRLKERNTWQGRLYPS
ncbi:MAG: TIGR01212 family radical SAM protein [Acidobacteria bacterium]|nr:TIGR01212 family radical SAM protein [Acidobacteriota bacterium]